MTDLSHHLVAVLDELPIAIALVSRTGHFLGKTGGMAGLLGDIVPSHDAREAVRWTFHDKKGAAIPRTEWPSARALRGERNYAGMIGRFVGGDARTIKVVSVPTFHPTSEVAAVTFLQVLDARGRSADGSHLDLQQKLIDGLARSVASGWDNFDPVFQRPAA